MEKSCKRLSQKDFQKLRLLYSLWKVSLRERKNGQIPLNFREYWIITINEYKKQKQNFWWELLLMRFFVVSNQGYSLNNCYQIRLWIILIVALIKLFFLIKFQIYYYFVITTEKYDGTLLLRRNCYKRLKSF